MNTTLPVDSPTEAEELNVGHELLGDIQALASEAAVALGHSLKAKPTRDELLTLRAQFEVAQEHFAELCDQTKEKVTDAAEETDRIIKSNPYKTAAIATGLGLLAGFLLGRLLPRRGSANN